MMHMAKMLIKHRVKLSALCRVKHDYKNTLTILQNYQFNINVFTGSL